MASVASGSCGVFFFISRWCLVVVRYQTEEGEELFSARTYRVNGKMKAVVKRALFWVLSVLSVKKVSLWATVALHLWGVQVTGLAAKWTGYVFKGC